jgi:hypothetical protein
MNAANTVSTMTTVVMRRRPAVIMATQSRHARRDS